MGRYHDESGVFVGFLAQGIQFSDGIVECLFSEMACSVGRVQDFVVEYGKVKGKTETDLDM